MLLWCVFGTKKNEVSRQSHLGRYVSRRVKRYLVSCGLQVLSWAYAGVQMAFFRNHTKKNPAHAGLMERGSAFKCSSASNSVVHSTRSRSSSSCGAGIFKAAASC